MDPEDGGPGPKPDPAAREAGKLARLARGASEALKGAGMDSSAMKLEALAREAEKARRIHLDLSSGAYVARRAPLIKAMGRALEGAPGAWAPAMAELAQSCLEEDMPIWHACSLLAMLGVEPSMLDAKAAQALCLPLEDERALAGEPYPWDEAEGLEPMRGQWTLILARTGSPGS